MRDWTYKASIINKLALQTKIANGTKRAEHKETMSTVPSMTDNEKTTH